MKPATSSYTVTAPHTARTAPMVRLTTLPSPPYTHISPRRVLSTQWHCWGCSIAPTRIWGSAQPTSVFVSESAASYLTYADVCTFRRLVTFLRNCHSLRRKPIIVRGAIGIVFAIDDCIRASSTAPARVCAHSTSRRGWYGVAYPRLERRRSKPTGVGIRRHLTPTGRQVLQQR